MAVPMKARAKYGIGWRDLEVMNNMSRANAGWLPYKGFHATAKRLEANGYAKQCGFAAMPPHALYVLTDKGVQTLKEIYK